MKMLTPPTLTPLPPLPTEADVGMGLSLPAAPAGEAAGKTEGYRPWSPLMGEDSEPGTWATPEALAKFCFRH